MISSTHSRSFLLIMVALLLGSQAQAARTFVFNVPWTDADVEDAASHLPPPPPSPNCYATENVGLVGEWSGCNGLLIVENGTGAFGIHTAVNTGITVNSVTYGATEIFTGQVTDMSRLFDSNTAFNSDIGYWDTANVVDFGSMFSNAVNFNQPIGNWDTSSATDMAFMFEDAHDFNQDLTSWDTSKVTSFVAMFVHATAFNGDITGWDTSSALNMNAMLRDTPAFNHDLSGWCVSNFASEPNYFNEGGQLTVATKPQWGTCP